MHRIMSWIRFNWILSSWNDLHAKKEVLVNMSWMHASHFLRPLTRGDRKWLHADAAAGGGFKQVRLDQKGLHAVLIPIGDLTKHDENIHYKMRHILPQEVCMLNGMFPCKFHPTEESDIRLELAGTGQMASPIQSCWVISNVLFQPPRARVVAWMFHLPDMWLRNYVKNSFVKEIRFGIPKLGTNIWTSLNWNSKALIILLFSRILKMIQVMMSALLRKSKKHVQSSKRHWPRQQP